MWGLNRYVLVSLPLKGKLTLLSRFRRPAWSTGTLIPASFLCGIASAIFIARGSAKTKRTQVVKDKLRAALELEYPAFEKDQQVQIPAPMAAMSTIVESPTVYTPISRHLVPSIGSRSDAKEGDRLSHAEDTSFKASDSVREEHESLVDEKMTIPAITVTT